MEQKKKKTKAKVKYSRNDSAGAEKKNSLEKKVQQALLQLKRKPTTLKELAKAARIQAHEQDEFLGCLKEMKQRGQLFEEKHRLFYSKNFGLSPGEISKINETYGFVKKLDTEEELFVPGRFLHGAMPGDMVLVKTMPDSKGGDLPTAEVIKIIEKNDLSFSGRVVKRAGSLMIVPDKYVRFPIQVKRGQNMKLKDGDKVLARISTRGERHSGHIAQIVKAYGSSETAGNCAKAIVESAGVHYDFPPEVEAEAALVSQAGIHPKEAAGRLDLRQDVIFTIDGADSKDLDDAVSIQKTEYGWKLGVHIADVSYYVQHGSSLDREAFERGTSIYYAASVIPMLPKELSNGICSLNPGEDRLAFSALMELDAAGEMTSYSFKKTIIRSRVKGVYAEVNEILKGTASAEILNKYDGLTDTIFEMRELAGILSKRRASRGAVDLSSQESKIILDENGIAVDILPRVQGESESIIEEFMLQANQAAAKMGGGKQLPFLYRVHEKPPKEKVEDLVNLLNTLGINCAGIRDGAASPAALSAILKQVRGKPLELLINNQILRTMAKAVYSDRNIGHFGLVMDDYSHFTSPIRRYPDLMIHRILSAYVTGMRPENIVKRFEPLVKPAANQSSAREIRAMNIERDCEDCYKAEYMKKYIGHVFDGVISSVAPHGLYVQLPNTVEGMIRVENLPDDEYEYEMKVQFAGKYSKRVYRVGDAIRIMVVASDVSSGKIDFTPYTEGMTLEDFQQNK